MFWKRPALLVPALCGFGTSFIIAKDCNQPGAARQESMKEKTAFAFQRVLDANQELKKVVDRAPDARKEVKEVASYLFPEQEWGKVQKRFEALTKRAAIPKTSDKDNDNTQDRDDGQPSEELDNDEIVIYCSGDRLTWKDGRWWDPVWDIQLTKANYEECFMPTVIDGAEKPKTQAWTMSWHDGKDYRPSVIQMCPWFIEQSIDQPQPMKCSALDKLKAKVSGDKDLKAKVDASNKEEADGYADFVGVIVHELSHTKPGGETSDAGRRPGEEVDRASYGWKNCVNLKSSDNADSYIQLANMVYIIKYCGQSTDKDGKIYAIKDWKAPGKTPPGTPGSGGESPERIGAPSGGSGSSSQGGGSQGGGAPPKKRDTGRSL